MEMTKQRKMLIGVLCVGLTGLAVDRFIIGSPESATASDEVLDTPTQPAPTAEPSAEQASTPQGTVQASKALPSYASLTERLVAAQQRQATASAQQDRQDPFALPKQWQSDQSKAPTQSSQDADSRRNAHLTGLFKLDGTVRSRINGQEEILAVISGGGLDGRAIRVGQQIKVPYDDGTSDVYTLVEVGSRYVVWKSLGTGKRIRMHVEKVL